MCSALAWASAWAMSFWPWASAAWREGGDFLLDAGLPGVLDDLHDDNHDGDEDQAGQEQEELLQYRGISQQWSYDH